jgi:hypothetical protein
MLETPSPTLLLMAIAFLSQRILAIIFAILAKIE